MSYNDRIDAALAAIKEHNEAIGGENKSGYLNSDYFIQCVKASGGTSEDRLSALSHEDLLACMPASDNGVKPRVLAKEIADIFRNKSKKEVTRPISGNKAERMTPRELVEAFDPEDYSNAVGNRLSLISNGEKFIVYLHGRTIDVETTFKLLSEIKSGYSGRVDIDVGGTIKKVYRLGELPENYADENPLYKNRPLRPDGTCDQTGRSWEGVELSIRQLIRLAIDEKELQVTHAIAHDVLDFVMGLNQDDTLRVLRSRYRKAAIKFDELAAIGSLPMLKIPLNNCANVAGPFADGKQVAWSLNPGLPNAYLSR